MQQYLCYNKNFLQQTLLKMKQQHIKSLGRNIQHNFIHKI